MERGNISPRAARKHHAQEKALRWMSEDVADNSRVKGAMSADHINRNGRKWPKGTDISASHRSWSPKRQAPIPNYGGQYSGRSGRP
jgi:hypothetical protein